MKVYLPTEVMNVLVYFSHNFTVDGNEWRNDHQMSFPAEGAIAFLFIRNLNLVLKIHAVLVNLGALFPSGACSEKRLPL